MSERIVLLTIRRENPTQTELLVRGTTASWVPVSNECATGELPVEAAVRAGEELFGADSVCSLWLLGKAAGQGVSHFYCLDLDAVAVAAPLPDGYTWINLSDAAATFSGPEQALFAKLNIYQK
jgi:hypothetical protein